MGGSDLHPPAAATQESRRPPQPRLAVDVAWSPTTARASAAGRRDEDPLIPVCSEVHDCCAPRRASRRATPGSITTTRSCVSRWVDAMKLTSVWPAVAHADGCRGSGCGGAGNTGKRSKDHYVKGSPRRSLLFRQPPALSRRPRRVMTGTLTWFPDAPGAPSQTMPSALRGDRLRSEPDQKRRRRRAVRRRRRKASRRSYFHGGKKPVLLAFSTTPVWMFP